MPSVVMVTLWITDLASTSRRIERPEQSSRHSLVLEFGSSIRFLDLKRFSATVKVSRPGRNPASCVSLVWRIALCPALRGMIRARAAAAALAVASARLAHSQNFIEPRFKVFLSFRPQSEALHGHSLLRRAHPAHEFLYILSCFLLIFPQILRLRHPHQKARLFGMLRLRDAPVSSSEQPSVPSKHMLEAEIGHEVPRFGIHAAIVFGPVTKNIHALGLKFPACRFLVANPQIPARRNFITNIAGEMLPRKVGDLRRSRQVAAQIVFFQRRFRKIHGSNRQPRKSRWGRRERHRSKEMLEVREHVLLVEVAHPDARVGTVGH